MKQLQSSLDVGDYPTTAEGLAALLDVPAGVGNWSDPYLKKNKIPPDPGAASTAIVHRVATATTISNTLGKDDTERGEKDDRVIVSWE